MFAAELSRWLRREAQAHAVDRPGMNAPTVPLRQLRALLAVVECGSATEAAHSLHLSVSAVSRAVHQAETTLGLVLFERGARGMVATPAAALLVSRVARALAQLQAAQAALPALARRTQGRGARAPAAVSAMARNVTEAMLLALGAVADTGSEASAGQRLHLSQVAVHQQLHALEFLARVALFERSQRGTRLTEAGERLLLHAKLALAELRIGHDELAAFQGHTLGHLSVGALPMAGSVLLPQALSRLFLAAPEFIVTVADGTHAALMHQLRHGDIDLVVGPLRGAAAASDVVEHRLFTDRLLAVVRPGHPALGGDGRRAVRGLRALRGTRWIGPLPGTPAQDAFDRVFAAAGLPVPAFSLQAHSTGVLVGVLAGSDAVALMSPWQVRTELDAGTLVALPLPLQGSERDIGVTLRRDGLPSAATRALLAELQAVAAAG